MAEEIAARLTPTAFRRVFGVGMLALLGAMLLFFGFDGEDIAFGWRIVMILMGGGALAGAEMMRRATANSIELTDEELRDTSGVVLCRLDEIENVDRSAFAFKPSNGFVVVLKSPADMAWAPGLWWRMGRRIGIGGVTPVAHAKAMCEILTIKLSERAE
ncbi:MAG: hypothetical protein HUJ27_01785 [Rhodobacteraceae bacterium]|nr:hypothetical protein [Paracoccaceae bacterium]